MNATQKSSVVILGATGAVGGSTLAALIKLNLANKITLLGRRNVEGLEVDYIKQYLADIFDPSTYANHLASHDVAICTLGVGEPSKISRDKFVQIDKIAVLEFAKMCKENGIQHFQLLSSVGINSKSSNFFLRTKGELVDELKKLDFNRLSIFQPSMIITPTNRYGFSQALVLKFWPIIDKLFLGSLQKYKGIKVEDLGKAIACNVIRKRTEEEFLTWTHFQQLIK